jgi:hypothetical protein
LICIAPTDLFSIWLNSCADFLDPCSWSNAISVDDQFMIVLSMVLSSETIDIIMTNVQVTPPGSSSTSLLCPDKFNCPPGLCPDFTIKRHDTHPVFSVPVTDASGPLDLTGLVLEASMWLRARLKLAITGTDTTISLAGNVGFEQILVNDIIIMDRVRSPEQMRVTGFDESNHLINVIRGYSSTAVPWKRGQCMRIFRFMNSPGITEMVYDDVLQTDGCTKNQLVRSNITYEWLPNDTCTPGCFFLEFKLMKMGANVPNQTPLSGCGIGTNVEWVRRFPLLGDGYNISIVNSPTTEL